MLCQQFPPAPELLIRFGGQHTGRAGQPRIVPGTKYPLQDVNISIGNKYLEAGQLAESSPAVLDAIGSGLQTDRVHPKRHPCSGLPPK